MGLLYISQNIFIRECHVSSIQSKYSVNLAKFSSWFQPFFRPKINLVQIYRIVQRNHQPADICLDSTQRQNGTSLSGQHKTGCLDFEALIHFMLRLPVCPGFW